MKKQIVNVSVVQSSKVVAVMYMLISLPVLAIMAILGALAGKAGPAILMLIIAPPLYGLVTFLCTGLLVWIYNVVARRVGGVEFSTEDMSGSVKA